MLYPRRYNIETSDTAMRARRLSRSAIAHITLTTDSQWGQHWSLLDAAQRLSPVETLIPTPSLLDSSPNSIKASLAFLAVSIVATGSSDKEREFFWRHLTAYSDALAECPDRSFLAIFSWLVSCGGGNQSLAGLALNSLRGAYRGSVIWRGERTPNSADCDVNYIRNINDALTSLNEAFPILMTPALRELFDCDTVLTNKIRCIVRIVAHKHNNFVLGNELTFGLLETCETILRSPCLPQAAREVGRNLRIFMGGYFPLDLRHIAPSLQDTCVHLF